MIIIESELKLDEPYNDCPGKESVKEALDRNVLENNYEFVDLDKKDMPHWQNELDTIVIKLQNKGLPVGLGVASVVNELGADEFMWIRTADNNYILRFWWD